MSDWKRGAAERRDARNVKAEARDRPAPSKKDTRRWCRGKPGVEHRLVAKRYDRLKSHTLGLNTFRNWWVRYCSECGRELEHFYPFGKSKKPDWVVEAERSDE